MKKNILLLIAIFTFSFVPQVNLFANVTSEVDLPEIYVRNLMIERNELAPGAEVKGSFSLENDESYAVSDVRYYISLVKEYEENGLAKIIFDEEIKGPVFLQAKEKKTLTFSYTLPPLFSADKGGVQVTAVLRSGVMLGWDDVILSVPSSGREALILSKVFLLVGEKSYASQEGPIIYKEEKHVPVVSVELVNPNEGEQRIVPSIRIFDRSVFGELLSAYNEEALVVRQKSSANMAFALPTFDYKAGVYAAVIDLRDATSNEKIGPTFEIRYIVAGEIATIHSVVSDVESVEEGQIFNVVVFASGTPYDIETNITESDGNAEMFLKMMDDKGRIVASDRKEVDLNTSLNFIFNLTSERFAKNLFASVELVKNGKVLASYETSISPQGSASKSVNSNPLVLLIILLVLFVSTLVMIKKIKRNSGSNFTNSALVFLLVFAGSFVFHNSAQAFTTIQTQFGSVPPSQNLNGYTPRITVNSPSGTLAPNQAFTLTGSTRSLVCSNTLYNLNYEVWYQGVSGTKSTFSTSHGGGGSWTQRDHAFSHSRSDFRAPSTPGTYRIYVKVTVSATGEWSYGYQEFTVAAPQPPAEPTNFTATMGSCGRKVNLSWNPVSGADSYKVYRNGNTEDKLIATITGTSYIDTVPTSFSNNPILYSVRAVDNGVQSSSASAWGTRSEACPLNAPTLSANTSGTCGGIIQLSWNQVGGATGYRVFRDGAFLKNISGGSAISTTDTGTPGQSYSYKIRATDGSQFSVDSNTATAVASVACIATPAPPVITVQTGPTCGGQTRVTWTVDPTVTSYTLFRNGTAIQSNVTTPFTDTGLSPGASYSYQLRAQNAGGQSDSNTQSANASAACVVPPPAPTVTASTSGTCGGRINVSWTAVSGATSYKLYRMVGATGTLITANATSPFNDTGLSPGQTYGYSVKAVNASGESAYSVTASAAASVACPPSSPVVTTGMCGGNVNLSWSAVTGATGYNVYRSTTSGGTYTKQNTTPITGTTFMSSGTPNSNYFYKISSLSGASESLQSTVSSGTASSACPATPPPPTVTTGSCGGKVNLSWSAVTGATGYNVYRSTTSGGTYTKQNTTPITGTAHVDTGTVSATYFYKISAVNGSFESAQSSSRSGQSSAACVVAPVAPTVSAATGSCGGKIDVTWTTVAGATTYELYRDGSSTPFNSNATSPFVDNVTIGSSHTYRVKAVNSAGSSPFSNITPSVTASSACVTPPSAPTITATMGACGGSINISWTMVSGLTYKIYRDGSSTPFNSNATSPFVDNVTIGSSHTYRVKAVNGAGESDFSNTANATASGSCGGTQPQNPPAPTVTTGACGGNINLSWNSVSGADGYNIYRSDAAGGIYIKENGSLVSGTAHSSTGDPDTSYFFKITAVNVFGESVFSDVASGTSSSQCANPVTVSCVALNAAGEETTEFTVGETVRWRAIIQNGSAPFDYRWSGDGFSTFTTTRSNTDTIFTPRVYTTTGSKNVQILVTGAHEGECSANAIHVKAKPIFEPF